MKATSNTTWYGSNQPIYIILVDEIILRRNTEQPLTYEELNIIKDNYC